MTEQTNTTPSAETTDAEGVTVRGGPAGFSRQVSTASELHDSDIIRIDDMDVSVRVAKDLGLLNRVFDEGLNSGSASQQTDAPEPKYEVVEKSNTGNAQYDEAIDSLNVLIDEGAMTMQEAQVYDTSLAQVAMAGLQVEQVVETLSGLADGSINEMEVPSDVRQMSKAIETNVRQASETSAMSELGRSGFDELQQLAMAHPGVNEVVYQYAVDRMQGKHGDISWSDLHADLREQLGM